MKVGRSRACSLLMNYRKGLARLHELVVHFPKPVVDLAAAAAAVAVGNRTSLEG